MNAILKILYFLILWAVIGMGAVILTICFMIQAAHPAEVIHVPGPVESAVAPWFTPESLILALVALCFGIVLRGFRR